MKNISLYIVQDMNCKDHNVFHIRLYLFLKQLDMNEEDILRITDELLLRRSFILETVLSYIYPSTILFGEGKTSRYLS
jgi:hypothetical protein